jgi:nucleoid-associated protein YgaU
MGAYNNSRVIKFKEGDFNLIRIPFVYNPSNQDKVHTVIEGDRLDTLAHKFYGNSRLWHIIADSNDIINPFELEIGIQLIIPGNV